MTLYDEDVFEVDGARFRFKSEWDDSGILPWENDCMHGPVSDWTRDRKSPGEMVLCEDSGSRRLYDFKAAVQQALKDGWGLPESEQARLEAIKGKPLSKREIAHTAALADFERLRRFCSDQWCYIGITVTRLVGEDDEDGETRSLWGIESDCAEYLEEVAHELARELLAEEEAEETARDLAARQNIATV